MFFDYFGNKIYYQEFCTSSSKTPQTIVFLHGWGSESSVFHGVVQRLSARYRCLLVDLVGFGQSDIPTIPFSVEMQADCILQLCNFLEIKKFHILSHSYGGRISLQLLSSEDSRIVSALLVAPAGVRERSVKKAAKIKWFKLRKKLTRKKNVHKLEKYYSSDFQQSSGVVREMFNLAISFDQTFQLRDITAKVLIVRGNIDSAISKKVVQKMAKRIKNAELREIEGDHFAFIQSGAQFGMIAENFFA